MKAVSQTQYRNRLSIFFTLLFASIGIYAQVRIGDIIDGSDGRRFGEVTAMNADGTIFAISDFYYTPFGSQVDTTTRGEVYVYQRIGDEFHLLGDTISDGQPSSRFGKDLNLSDDGQTLAIGFVDSLAVYQFINNQWSLKGDILSDARAFRMDKSGKYLAVSRNFGDLQVYKYGSNSWNTLGPIISIASGRMDQGYTNFDIYTLGQIVYVAVQASGGIQVYFLNGSIWTPLGGLIPSHSEDRFFGESISLSKFGLTLSATTDNGRVYCYEYNGTQWLQKGNVILFESSREIPAQLTYDTDHGLNLVCHSDEFRGDRFIKFKWNGSDWQEMGHFESESRTYKLAIAQNGLHFIGERDWKEIGYYILHDRLYCGSSVMEDNGSIGYSFFDDYNCATDDFSANEVIYQFELLAETDIAIENIGIQDMWLNLFQLDNNGDFICVKQSESSIEETLDYGIYYLSVDQLNNITGEYELDIDCMQLSDCSNAHILPLNTYYTVSTIGDIDQFYGFSCSTERNSNYEEKIYQFTLSDTSDLLLSADLLFLPGFYILSSCDPSSCIYSGSAYFSGYIEKFPPGTYYLVFNHTSGLERDVDIILNSYPPGFFSANNVNCEDYDIVTSGDTLGGNAALHGHLGLYETECHSSNPNFSPTYNPNLMYKITLDQISTMTISGVYDDRGSHYNVTVLSDCEGSICLGSRNSDDFEYGDLQLFNLLPDTYYILLDPIFSHISRNTHDVIITVIPSLNCDSALNTRDINCGNIINDNNGSGINYIDNYSCLQNMTGKEILYRLELTDTTSIHINLLAFNIFVRAILLDACDASQCLGSGRSFNAYNLSSGIYYIVIDGEQGASADYTLTLSCLEECEENIDIKKTDVSQPAHVKASNFLVSYKCDQNNMMYSAGESIILNGGFSTNGNFEAIIDSCQE